MANYNFGNVSGGGDRGTAFTDQFVYYDMGLPGVRTAMDGTRPMIIVGLTFNVDGRNGTPSIYGELQGAASGTTAAHGVGPSSGANSFDGFGGIGAGARNGGSVRVIIRSNGSFYWNRNSGGPGVCINNFGTGFAGSLAGSMDYVVVPDAPNTPSITPSADGRSARVIFAFNGWNGDSGITRYRIQYANNPNLSGAALVDTGGGDNTIGGLTPGQTYWWRVTACNWVSDWVGLPGGNWSGIAAAGQPSAPGVTTISSLNTTANGVSSIIDWLGVAGATSYTLQRSTNSSFTTDLTSVNTASGGYRFDGLMQGVTYYYRVRANNAVGGGSFSATRSAQQPSVPSAPTLISVNPSQDGTSAVVTFNATGISDRGSPILGYRLQKATNATFTANLATISVSPGDTTVTNLSPSAQYWWRVAAYNAASEFNGAPGGDWSNVLGLTQPDPGVGKIRNAANGLWVDMEGRIRNATNTAFVQVDGRIRNAANTAWVELGS